MLGIYKHKYIGCRQSTSVPHHAPFEPFPRPPYAASRHFGNLKHGEIVLVTSTPVQYCFVADGVYDKQISFIKMPEYNNNLHIVVFVCIMSLGTYPKVRVWQHWSESSN